MWNVRLRSYRSIPLESVRVPLSVFANVPPLPSGIHVRAELPEPAPLPPATFLPCGILPLIPSTAARPHSSLRRVQLRPALLTDPNELQRLQLILDERRPPPPPPPLPPPPPPPPTFVFHAHRPPSPQLQ